jgi:hypothetical protein
VPFFTLTTTLVGVLGREFHDRRPDNTGLISWVVKVYCVCARVSANVINAAQEVIRVAMSSVRGTLGENIGPTSSDLERVITNPQESQNTLRRAIDAGNEVSKVFQFM